jgi:hypothetical protein
LSKILYMVKIYEQNKKMILWPIPPRGKIG